jgi:hypothetical protein
MSERDLFITALRMDDPAERAAYLSEACGSDQDLRRRVEEMLRQHSGAGYVLDAPAGTPNETIDSQPDERDLILHDPPTVAPVLPSETVGMRIGPFKLLQQLGEGGMGIVWVAEQTEPVKRRVALKVTKPGMDSARVLHRFEAERQWLTPSDDEVLRGVRAAQTVEESEKRHDSFLQK